MTFGLRVGAASIVVAAAFGFACPCLGAETPQAVGHGRILVSADRVSYFSDENVVTARGNVTVTLPDGAVAEGDAFSMDLRQRRLLVAGHTRFRTPAGEYDGAAVSDFLEFRRVYFLPLVPVADRWTFENGDYFAPAKGLDMPGDAFELPDLRGHRPYITGRTAVIDASTFVDVEPATTAVLMGPDTPPLPAFVDNFSSNPAFGQNSLAGATFDAPYPFYGTSHTLETFHIRYDQARANPYFLSFEHHSVADDGAYAVVSLNPMTQIDKQWNLLGYVPAGGAAAISLEAQLFTLQNGLAQPSSSNGFADIRYVRGLRESSVLADATQSYDALVAGPALPNHPFIFGVQWNGYEQRLARTGWTYRLSSSAAWIHDALGVSGQARRDVSATGLGIVAASPAFAGPFASTVNAIASAQRSWLDFPNTVSSQSIVVSDGKEFAARLFGVLSASSQSVQTGNPALTIVSPNAATGLSPAPRSPNGLPVFGTPTTAARAVDRDYSLTLSWQPAPEFQFAATGSRVVYSPGQPIAPQQLSMTARANVTRTLYVTVGRLYYFNWRSEAWSPRFSFQVSSQ